MADGSVPAVRLRAPGRVNLIGGHVDFHEGPVVSAAVNRWVSAEVRRRDDALVAVTSDAYEGVVEVAADGGRSAGRAPSTVTPAWGRLVAGVLAVRADDGRAAVGFDAEVRTDLTIGGGLSSSAAFEVLMGMAAAWAAGERVEAMTLAAAAQRAEHEATGVPCGIQDQVTSAVGGVILLDCRTLDIRSVTLPAGTALLVIDSGVSRTLEGSPWAAKRSASLELARSLGLRVLRDATAAQVGADPLGRHVVEEIERVHRFAGALDAGDAVGAGALMVSSHESSRDLWGSSTPELDALVELALAAGAHGARLTGGGFGGCVVALVPAAAAADLAQEVVAAYDRRWSAVGRRASASLVEVADGAGPC